MDHIADVWTALCISFRRTRQTDSTDEISRALFFSWPFRKSAVVHARRPGPDCDDGQWLSDLLTSKVETIPCKWVKPSDSVASRAPRSTSNKVDNRQLEW